MASGFNDTTGAGLLKRYYSPTFIANTIASKGSPLLALCKKVSGYGDSYNFPSIVSDIPSGSADFAKAQTVGQGNTIGIGSQFNVSYFEDHEVPSVQGSTLAKMKGTQGGWENAMKIAMDSSLRIAAHRLATAFFTQGWGELGTCVTGGAGSATMVVSPLSNIVYFYPGQNIQFAADIATSTFRAGGPLVVSGVNYSTGTITFTANTNSITSLTAGDFMFTDGDRQSSATAARLRPAGLPAWLLQTAAASNDSFFGVNRSVSSRLQGNFVDGTTESISDALIDMAQICTSVGNAEKLVAAINPQRYSDLSKSLQGQARFETVKGSGGAVGFASVVVNAYGIDVNVIADKYCPLNAGYMIDPTSVEVASVDGPAPHIDTTDGNQWLRQSSSDGVEARIVSYFTYAFKNTAACGVIKLPST